LFIVRSLLGRKALAHEPEVSACGVIRSGIPDVVSNASVRAVVHRAFDHEVTETSGGAELAAEVLGVLVVSADDDRYDLSAQGVVDPD
jgi:hypothetical protein